MTVCQSLQSTQADNVSDAQANDESDAHADATSDAKKRRRCHRVKEFPKGGLIEVLADDDPRKPEWPIVEYICSASIISPGLIIPSVIAVHGLGSKYPKTWMKDDTTLWLEDFLPNDLPQARILAFIYPSEAFNNPDFVDLRALGGSLLRSLAKDREGLFSKVGSVYFAPNR
jgi:hypothetical protein